MKKYLMIFAALAFLLVGCAQNEIVENRSENNAIGFRTLNDKVTKNANADNQAYGVYAAWKKGGESAEYINPWFMKNQLVENNGNYTPSQYWPHEGVVDFFAYAPHSTLTNSRLTIEDGTVGTPVVTYTVKSDAHEDFTVANPMLSQSKTNTDNKVDFQFNHMLSKLTVGVQLDGTLDEEDDEASSLVAAGFTLDLSKASVELIVAENSRKIDLQTSAPAWNTNYETATAPSAYSHPFVVGETTANPHFMVMPQSTIVEEASKVSLQLKNVIIKKDGVIYWGGESGANLAVYNFKGTGDITNLEPNKHYVITFTIKDGAQGSEPDSPVFGDAIEFTSSIAADWATPDGVDIDQPNGPTQP